MDHHAWRQRAEPDLAGGICSHHLPRLLQIRLHLRLLWLVPTPLGTACTSPLTMHPPTNLPII